jgi:hypothetical protein
MWPVFNQIRAAFFILSGREPATLPALFSVFVQSIFWTGRLQLCGLYR